MPYPHLSAALNNCSLHGLTPELCQQISTITANSNADYAPAYEKLKEKFIVFYGFESLTWFDFCLLLGAYNPFDVQIILGPVLRMVMADYMREKTEQTTISRMADERFSGDDNNERFIEEKTCLQDNGRYSSLSPDELFVFLAEPFVLNLIIHKDRTERIFPETKEAQALFKNRPILHLYHEGGVEGAEAGGHWERTNNPNDRIDYKNYDDAYLALLADFFKNGTRELSDIGLYLLKQHVIKKKAIIDDDACDHVPELNLIHLTMSQIEKFIYNRAYVDKERAKKLLGRLTPEAESIIEKMADVEDTTDAQITALIDANLPGIASEIPAKPLNSFTPLEYQIALILLTPPVAQNQGHAENDDLWELRANEISALAYVEAIVFNEGLSEKLYAVCNQPSIMCDLSFEFLALLSKDEHFNHKASDELKKHWDALQKEKLNNAAPNTLLNLCEESKNNNGEGSSISTPEKNAQVSPLKQKQSDMTAHFYLRSMKFFLYMGGLGAVVALLTCPPMTAVLGISSVAGITSTNVSIVVGALSLTSLLTGASIFMMRDALMKADQEGISQPMQRINP
ncbi:MAG TPA: hypothetical protein VHD33_04400 [Legionellaceae bacterium]|nr:hypothetical protein [Legionellaceae bacterium]